LEPLRQWLLGFDGDHAAAAIYGLGKPEGVGALVGAEVDGRVAGLDRAQHGADLGRVELAPVLEGAGAETELLSDERQSWTLTSPQRHRGTEAQRTQRQQSKSTLCALCASVVKTTALVPAN